MSDVTISDLGGQSDPAESLPELELLYQNGPLHIDWVAGHSKRVVLSFSGTGSLPEERPAPEFVRLASQGGANTVLYISDKSRSWLNHPGMAEEIADVAEEVASAMQAEEMIALGNSMGGTSAMLMTEFLAFNAVIAFAPQFSVDPSVLPYEHRWTKFRRYIEDFRFPHVGKMRDDGPPVFLFHGTHPNELQHALRFLPSRAMRQFIFPGLGHDLAGKLKSRGHLEPLIQLAMDAKAYKLRTRIERLGGQRLSELLRDKAAV